MYVCIEVLDSWSKEKRQNKKDIHIHFFYFQE